MRTRRAALALGGSAVALGTTGMTPRLPDDSEVVGAWRLDAPDGAHVLELRLAPPRRRTVAWAGAAPAGLEAVRGWRVASDGLALTGADGLTLVFLERLSPDTYRTGAAARPAYALHRSASAPSH